MKNKVLTTRRIALIGMLTALIVVLGMSGLGIIDFPFISQTLSLRITILHIPVIIGAILEGPVVGAVIGLLFGVWSIIDKIIRPTATGFVFYNPLVSILPRILIGIVAYYSYYILKKSLPKGISIGFAVVVGYYAFYICNKAFPIHLPFGVSVGIGAALFYYTYTAAVKGMPEIVSAGFAALLATLMNTVGVLGMIYIIYADKYMQLLGKTKDAALPFLSGVAATNGIPEAIAAAVLVPIIVIGIKKIRKDM